jgi:hypothetical protein
MSQAAETHWDFDKALGVIGYQGKKDGPVVVFSLH